MSEPQRILELLDQAASASKQIAFWWRDDDAADATPELARLLRLASTHHVPLGLAVIPAGATESLASAIAAAPGVAVLQHGWSHARHNPEHEKKAELGDHRPADEILAELAAGRSRLADLFGRRFLSVLVPPWNRMGQRARARRHEVGLTGLSVFGPSGGEPHTVNTHLDLMDWTTRAGLSSDQACAILAREMERRLAGADEPIGLLTHHLVHDEAAWQLLDELLTLLASHPAVHWPQIDALFGLPAAGWP